MTEADLVTGTQLAVLARVLQVPPRHLAPLARLGAAGLHELQGRMVGALFDQHLATFRRTSALVPLVPLGIGIPVMQRRMPAMIAGRLAGALGVDHPRKAAAALSLLDPVYAADCAPYLDPRVIGQLASEAPPEPLMPILNEILRRGDYVTAAGFMAAATPPMIEAMERLVLDDAGLIFTAAYAYSTETISTVVRQLLSGPRLTGMMQTVLAGPPALQHAMLAVFCRFEPDVAIAVGDILFGHGPAPAVGRFVFTAVAGRAVPELLTVLGMLSSFAHWSLASNPVFTDRRVLAAMVTALHGGADAVMWRGLFTLAARLGKPVRRELALLLMELPEEAVAALPAHATDAQCWPVLLELLTESDGQLQDRLARVWSRLPPERRGGLHEHIHRHGYDARLARISEALVPVSLEEVYFHRRRRIRHRGE